MSGVPTKGVYAFMKTKNRPLTVNDIVTQVDKTFPTDKCGKSAIQKALDELVKKERVIEKVGIVYLKSF